MSVWFPMLPIDVLRRADRRRAVRDDRPVLLFERQGQRRVVACCCERAIALSARAGMPLGEARAVLARNDVRVEPSTPERDLVILRTLAVWAQRFSPVVALDAPDGLLIDVSGCARVFHGEDRLIASLCTRARAIGFHVLTAIAPTFACARGIARYSGAATTIVPDDGARVAIAPLPVRALRLDDDIVSGLSEMGVDSIGQLLDLPARSLPSRFGPDVVLRLDQALGRALEIIDPIRPREPPKVERLFDGPTARLEAIELTVQDLLGQLVLILRQRESGARRIDIDLDRTDLEPSRLTMSLGRPCRDQRHLWSLLRPRLERVHLGFGVERIAMTAPWIGLLRHDQAEMWRHDDQQTDAQAERAESELIDTLINRLGPNAVLRARQLESHIPERAFRLDTIEPESNVSPAPTHPPPDRPSLLFPNPVPAQVISLTPDGPVLSARWQGRDIHITACIGPERIAGEWWRGDRRARDYFKVQDQSGLWLWLCREVDLGRWFVHGVWA